MDFKAKGISPKLEWRLKWKKVISKSISAVRGGFRIAFIKKVLLDFKANGIYPKLEWHLIMNRKVISKSISVIRGTFGESLLEVFIY